MRYFFFISIFLLALNSARAQDSLHMLSLMKEYGFQNIRINKYGEDSWRIDLENGRYRFTPFGLRRLLEKWEGGQDTFHFILRERDIPAAHLEYINGDIQKVDWDDNWLDVPTGGAIKGTRNFWQVNIPIGFGLRYQIGRAVNHEAIALDLLPGIDITLARGLSLQGTLAVPLTNDFDGRKSVRIDGLMLVKDLRLPERFFISVAGGIFQRNRVGVHVKWRKFFAEERIAIGMDGAITEFTGLTNTDFQFFEDRWINYYTFRLDYIWRKYNTRFEIHAGKFFEDELNVVFRAFRQFDEKRIGFEMRNSDWGWDGGFFVRWPLFPQKYTKPSRVRVVAAPYVDINYNYTAYGSRYQYYQWGNTLIDGLWEYWPTTVKRK